MTQPGCKHRCCYNMTAESDCGITSSLLIDTWANATEADSTWAQHPKLIPQGSKTRCKHTVFHGNPIISSVSVAEVDTPWMQALVLYNMGVSPDADITQSLAIVNNTISTSSQCGHNIKANFDAATT